MSEYQYYEFQAIDRPLTEAEMTTLRSFSTRARITPTSFVNEYEWGDFKGDEDAWMAKYFDAFLYLANWGTHVLKLRLSARALAPATARDYCDDDEENASVREKGGNVILTFSSKDDDGDGDQEWDGAGRLSGLIGVRAELARGDHRALYLAWLLGVQNGAYEDETREPLVPPGLNRLSASLESLVEFLRIDRDLLSVAAQASAPLESAAPKLEEIIAWLGARPTSEKDEWLARLMTGRDAALPRELLQRFEHERAGAPSDDKAAAARRTAGEIRRAAEAHAVERRGIAQEKATAERVRQERDAARARARHLDSIAGREALLWRQVQDLVATKTQKSFAAAVAVLVDLRDLAARGNPAVFQLRLEEFRAAHARKPALVARLRQHGL